ncbi:MAG TPA: redoxin domain-containing protein [Terriglobales bacterium]|nr:redoxin domain-containing protein [Terriglobales bacterium]
MLKAGDLVPDFDLPALIGGVKKRLHLAEWLGKRDIVLAFYPSNWEPVSAQQMVAFQAELARLQSRGTELAAICVDSIMNTTVWERDIGPFDFPLCSDFWPHGEVSRRYGVLREREPFAGASERAIFLVDRSGRVASANGYPLSKAPDLGELFEILTRK